MTQGNKTNGLIEEGHVGGFMAGGDPATWCPNLWDWVISKFNVRSVIDIGCGQGYAVRFFKDRGLAVTGIDGSQEAIQSSVAPNSVVQHDFCQNAYLTTQPIEMIWSCEFLEHIEENLIRNVLATMNLASKVIVITHAFPGQAGHHHVNSQLNTYWIGLLRRAGFRFALINTLLARWVTRKDYGQMNHFGRSGLLFLAPNKMSENMLSVRLEDLLRAGKHPDIFTHYYELILKIQNLALRAGRKMGLF